jgi:hypothetical protein
MIRASGLTLRAIGACARHGIAEALPIYGCAIVQYSVLRVDDLRSKRMLQALCFVHLNSKPGFIRNLPEPIDHADWTLNHIKVPRHSANHFLLDDVVWRRHSEMQGCGTRDRSERIVWCNPN